MMQQTELVRYKEIDICREQLVLTPTEWDTSLSVQQRLIIEDAVKRKLYLPIFVYRKGQDKLIFYGNQFYKAYKELCGKYNNIQVVIFEFNDPLDAVRQFVAWVALVLRRNVKRGEIRALMSILGLNISEGELRDALGPLSAFIESPPPRREPELSKEAQPQAPPPLPPPSQMPTPPPSLEEILKIRETVKVAEKLEKLGEKGKQLIERLDEKKVEKLMPILTEEQKVDVISELGKLPEKTLKTLIMLANSPHFNSIIEQLNLLYEHLAKVDVLLKEVAKRPEILDDVVDLLRSKLLNELLRLKDAWTDLAYWLSKFKSSEELVETLQ